MTTEPNDNGIDSPHAADPNKADPNSADRNNADRNNADRNNDDRGDAAMADTALPEGLVAALSNDETWLPLSSDLEESTIGAVMAAVRADEVSDQPTHVDASPKAAPHTTNGSVDLNTVPDNVVPLPSRWKTALLGAAAALLLVAGIAGIGRIGGESPDFEVALVGTERASEARAVAELTELDEGTLITLTLSGLDPAPAGTYYEAWLRQSPEIGVSAGTFHLRDGEGPIGLWAAVSPTDYPLLTVTLQPEAMAESSGDVVLRARLDQ